MAARYVAEMPVPDWRERLTCSHCGRQFDMVARVKCTRSPLLQPRIMSRQTAHCHLSLLRRPGDLVVPNAVPMSPARPLQWQVSWGIE